MSFKNEDAKSLQDLFQKLLAALVEANGWPHEHLDTNDPPDPDLPRPPAPGPRDL